MSDFGRRAGWMGAVAALLALHFLLAVGSKRHESTTSDEIMHLTGGLSYWRNNDYRLHPENGNLPQRWAALPAAVAGAKFPELKDNEYWRTSEVVVVGHQFFYETGEDHFPRLMAGRAMIALFSVATGLLAFCWSRSLFGNLGAFVSLVFFAFCPIFLAHGALVTSDVCMAFFFLAAVGAWWRHLHDGRARWWWLSALVLGLAFVAKYSAVLIVPMLIVMAAARALAPEPLTLLGRTFMTRAGKFGAAALSALGQGAVAVLLIWACYGFRYSAFNPALPAALDFIRPWDYFETSLGGTGRVIHALRVAHALPEAWLYGFAYVLETVKMRGAFLNGEYSLTGWPTFFLWTFWLKTTLPLLLACGLTAGLAVRRWGTGAAGKLRADLYRVLPLVTLFGVYWISSLTSHLNIGHRHILPTYPVLFIFVGALGSWLTLRRPVAALAVSLLLAWQVREAVHIYPHYLAYFNPLAGGPENGRFHLVDSSLDWGQDLPGLKAWLDNHPTGEPVYLSYFGTGEPAYYGIKARRLAFLNNFKFPTHLEKLEPGTYCISATILMEVYGTGHGTWTQREETDYQRLRAALEPVESGAHSEAERAYYDALRLARLCQYLRLKKPEADVGYSILIYRLSAGEIAAATGGSLAEWAGLIEQASAPGRP